VIFRIDGVLHDVLGRIHRRAANHHGRLARGRRDQPDESGVNGEGGNARRRIAEMRFMVRSVLITVGSSPW